MSILIKGMEMPTDGTFSIVHIYSDGHVSMPFWGKGMQIVSGITAVPVPPHGRLIDGDVAEVIHFTADDAEGRDFYDGILFAADWISKQPTIIEAKEET